MEESDEQREREPPSLNTKRPQRMRKLCTNPTRLKQHWHVQKQRYQPQADQRSTGNDIWPVGFRIQWPISCLSSYTCPSSACGREMRRVQDAVSYGMMSVKLENANQAYHYSLRPRTNLNGFIGDSCAIYMAVDARYAWMDVLGDWYA